MADLMRFGLLGAVLAMSLAAAGLACSAGCDVGLLIYPTKPVYAGRTSFLPPISPSPPPPPFPLPGAAALGRGGT